jgi:hypothetical protein
MQFDLTTPLCSSKISPLKLIRRYLLSWPRKARKESRANYLPQLNLFVEITDVV